MLSQLNEGYQGGQEDNAVTSDNNIPWWIAPLIVIGIITVLLLLVCIWIKFFKK